MEATGHRQTATHLLVTQVTMTTSVIPGKEMAEEVLENRQVEIGKDDEVPEVGPGNETTIDTEITEIVIERGTGIVTGIESAIGSGHVLDVLF